ncbi:hypothetical protein Cgig2_010351 [Carnegiea gigantea]|uniref:P-type ATPase A domain-containing protein n=1 Tax=Carnegiea gigantea TaxID=171969 RepID=A0A9Q1K4A5_9CARY|nr:hypothetical protein Cgig2_010351 [Carnegiea gigantea]
MAMFLAAAACPYLVPKPLAKSLQNAFIFIAFPLVGVSASLDALIDISGGKVNIHVLMALAAFASVFMGNSLEGGLLISMFNLAHIAEEHFTRRSMVDVRELKENYPHYALVLDVHDDKEPNFSSLSYKKVPVTEVDVGSFILVQAGETVPVDCVVSQGRSTVTIEHLTGELKPIERAVGDSIPGGARNLDGMLIVKDFSPFPPWSWYRDSGVGCRGSIYRALGLMVAASPCALAVAPLAYATAISACARKGILLKGGHVLDALASCHTIAFDKTGTLTTGELKLKAIEPIHGHGVLNDPKSGPCCVPSCEKAALAVAAAMEKGTTHPIGRAVVNHGMGVDLPPVSIESFESIPGRGLSATLSSNEKGIGRGEPLIATLGSVDYIASLCKSEDVSRKIMEAVGMSAYENEFVHAALSVNEKVTLFHFEDEPRPGVSDVIAWLRNQGKFRVMMLTGDHESSARRVANAVGITEVYCGLKPEDKLNHVVRTSRETGEGLIMVGDGINDAPALAAATVSIVLAQRASATAIAVADVLLLQDNISGVPFCIAKARQTASLVKQNVALALSAIIVASLPSVLGFLPLWLTVLLHEGGTLIVCLNSIRALNDPIQSLKQDLYYLPDKFKAMIMQIRDRIPSSGTMPTAQLQQGARAFFGIR